MAAWTAPEGDGEGTIAALIAATGAGMALMLWTQRSPAPAGDPAIDAACVFATVVALAAAAAGVVGRRRRRRRGGIARRTRAG